MPGLYGLADGVNRLPKKWIAPAAGVNREFKDIYGVDSGANRKIFSAGPAWTTNVTSFSETNPNYLMYGAHVTGWTGWIDSMYFDFTEPVFVNSFNDMLSVHPDTGTGSKAQRILYTDGTTDTGHNNKGKAVKRITILAGWVDSVPSQSIGVQGTLQVKSRDFGDFYLNKTGSILQ